MKSIIRQYILLVQLLALSSTVSAGHMFTQASSNTPTWIQSGQGIVIDQYGDEGGASSGGISIYFQANNTVPTAANTTNSDWWQWSAGDVMKINLPLSNATYTYTIAYDAASGNCAYDYCGQNSNQTSINISSSTLGDSGVALPAHSGQNQQYTSSDVAFSWSIEALAGEFSLGGYRLYTSAGTIDGTGAGPLSQSSVVSSEEVQQSVGGSSPPDIDTAKSEYTVTELNNGSVNAVFDGGVLQVDSAGSVTTAFTVNSTNGTIDSNGNDVDFSGAFSGTGEITKSGSGTVTLSGVNTHSGGTTVSGGTLQVSSDSNLGTGGITLNGGTLASSATMTTAKNIAVGASNGEFDVANGTTFTSNGVLSGVGGITKSGGGTVTLAGVNTHSGGTTVSGGTLQVEGTLASTTVNISSGSVLGGSGTLAGDVTVMGQLTPGSSPGTLTIAGDLTLTSGSTLINEIDGNNYSLAGGAGSYDRITLIGASSVFTADGTLEPILRGISSPATNSFTPTIGESFRIVTTVNASGVAGEFSSITQPALGIDANSRLDVVYGTNFIDIYVTPESYAALLTGSGLENMINAATAFDGIRPSAAARSSNDTGRFFNGLYGLTATQLSTALLQASGEIHVFALNDIRSGIRGMSSSLSSATRYAPVGENFWLDVGGHNASYKSDVTASAYDSNERHVWIGSHIVDDGSKRIGVAAGYSDGSVSTDFSASADRKTAALATYFYGSFDAIKVDGEFGLAHTWTDIDRLVGLSTGASGNESTAEADVAFANVNLGYESQLTDDINGSLMTRLGVEFIDADGYVESGSAATTLQVDQEFYRSAELLLGYSFNGSFTSEHGTGLWNLGLGATKQLAWNDQTLSRSVSMHGADWTVSTENADEVTKFLNVGIVFPLGAGSSIGLNLNATHSDDRSTVGGNVVFSTPL